MGIIDTVKGVFSGEDPQIEKAQSTNPNTPEQQKLYDMSWEDYQVFKEKRQEIEPTWREEDRFYEGGRKHWEGLRSEETMKARPNSVDNIAFSQIESIVSALTGWVPEGKFEPQEDGDDEKAQELARYMPFELRQIKFKPKHIKAVRRFVNHGLLLYMPVYDPTVEGGRGLNRYIGQNDIIPIDYGSFFPDPRIGDFLYFQQSKAVILHTVKNLEYFHENESYGEQGKKVQESQMASDVEIFDENKDDSTTYKAKRSGLIQYFYKGKPKLLTNEDKKLFKEMADQKLAEGKDPSECLARADGTAKGVHCIHISTDGVFLKHIPYMYDHGQYPIVVRSLFPVEGSLWPKGYMRDLISPQIMLNKFSELAVEQTAKLGNDAMMYEEGAISDSQKSIWKRIRSQVAAMLPVINVERVKEIKGAPPNPGIMQFIQHWLMILQKIPRRFDSANGGANFQGESGRHAEALQAASQGHLSTPTELIEDALCEVFEQIIELIAQFYKTDRIGRVLGKPVSISRNKLIKAVPTEYETGNTVPDPMSGQLVPEKIPVQEEYCPKFDIKVSIGVEMPRDREYWVNTAWMLLDKGMIDAEAVEYTIENGRMESFDIIKARMQKDALVQQKMAELEQENAVLNEQVNQMHGMMQDQQAQSEQNDMQATSETLKHLNEGQKMDMQQQEMQHRQMMDKQKMAIEAGKMAMMGQRQMVGAK